MPFNPIKFQNPAAAYYAIHIRITSFLMNPKSCDPPGKRLAASGRGRYHDLLARL